MRTKGSKHNTLLARKPTLKPYKTILIHRWQWLNASTRKLLNLAMPTVWLKRKSKLSEATYAAQQAKQFKPTALQEDQNEVQIQQVEQQRPRVDAKTQSWLDENPWYGTKKAMSNFAVGIHEELVDEYGKDIVGTDQYYKRIDQTMRKKFPEYFELDGDSITVEPKENQTSQRTKPSTVVAPATRSTSSKQVRLKASQMALIKKLGLSPEQYSREVLKLEV
jgi:hypothetical protein